MRLHIFNPDTDYALASGSRYYTPPAKVVRIAEDMANFPTKFSDPGDIVVAYADIDTIPQILAEHQNEKIEISPWGWNQALRHRLIEAGVEPSLLPSELQVENLRLLSHRRTSILANTTLNTSLNEHGFKDIHQADIPFECKDVDSAIDALRQMSPRFFKAPWSSSGRGILYTEDLDLERHIRPWIHGIIRRQGSVIAETAYPKVLDFATEWEINPDGCVSFIGLSLFEASRRGKYHYNFKGSQKDILEKIQYAAPDFGTDYIQCQQIMLSKVVGSKYHGPLGIDMLALPDGGIRGCIEINFRNTMGRAHIEIEKRK